MTESGPSRDVARLLRAWLPEQRWYAAKDRRIESAEVISAIVLRDGDPALQHWVVRVTTDDAVTADYQVFVGARTELPERLQYAAIGRTDDEQFYDAAHDPELMALVLEHIAASSTVDSLQFVREPDAPEIDTTQTSLVSSAEQSNTSLMYGNAYILKLFRKVNHGLNPDLEIHRALASVGCEHIAIPYGAIEGDLGGAHVTYAMLQEFVANAADGWQMATTSVRDLYAEADLHAEEVGGDFAGEAYRLGQATAEVHADLVRALGEREKGPEESTALAAQMRQRLADAIAVVPQLLPYAGGLREIYDSVGSLTEPVPVQRIHGDYHLGQVLRRMSGWLMLDFEGEPARPFAERTAYMSPLRDVAGMLRSFDYAARHLLTDHPGDQQLEYRANEWAERNREAFCDGYAVAASAGDPRKHGELLRAFELDKAVYEVVYEARNRPTWLPIPLGSIARLVA